MAEGKWQYFYVVVQPETLVLVPTFFYVNLKLILIAMLFLVMLFLAMLFAFLKDELIALGDSLIVQMIRIGDSGDPVYFSESFLQLLF